MEIKPKKIGEKFFYRLLFTGKPVDGNRFSVNDRKQNQRRQKNQNFDTYNSLTPNWYYKVLR